MVVAAPWSSCRGCSIGQSCRYCNSYRPEFAKSLRTKAELSYAGHFESAIKASFAAGNPRLLPARSPQQPLAAGTIAGYTLLMISSSPLSVNTSVAKQRELQTQCQLGAMTAVEVLDSYSVGSGFLKGLGGKSCSHCAIDRRIRTRH